IKQSQSQSVDAKYDAESALAQLVESSYRKTILSSAITDIWQRLISQSKQQTANLISDLLFNKMIEPPYAVRMHKIEQLNKDLAGRIACLYFETEPGFSALSILNSYGDVVDQMAVTGLARKRCGQDIMNKYIDQVNSIKRDEEELERERNKKLEMKRQQQLEDGDDNEITIDNDDSDDESGDENTQNKENRDLNRITDADGSRNQELDDQNLSPIKQIKKRIKDQREQLAQFLENQLYLKALDEFCALMKLHQPCLEKVLLSGDDPRLHQIKQDVDKIMDIPSEFNSDMNRDGRDQMRREEEYNWGDVQLTSEIVSKSCCGENMSSNKSGFPGLGTSYSHEKCSGGPLFNSENQINQNTSI
ncbi:MAG: hypothetical protein EZS28_038190, partial [Streblomastix strix]